MEAVRRMCLLFFIKIFPLEKDTLFFFEFAL